MVISADFLLTKVNLPAKNKKAEEFEKAEKLKTEELGPLVPQGTSESEEKTPAVATGQENHLSNASASSKVDGTPPKSSSNKEELSADHPSNEGKKSPSDSQTFAASGDEENRLPRRVEAGKDGWF